MLRKLSQTLAIGSRKVTRQVMVQPSRNCYPYHHQLQVIVRHDIKGLGFPEKLCWGFFMAAVLVSVPAWILVHLPEYRGETRETSKARGE